MFALAPSKADQAGLRYWARNRYRAHVEKVRWTNRAYTNDSAGPFHGSMCDPNPQLRLRHILMTEDQKAAVIRATGSSPFIEKVFAPVARGRSRTQTGRKKA